MTAPVKKVQIWAVMSPKFHSALSQDHETSPEDYLEIVSWPEILYIQNIFR